MGNTYSEPALEPLHRLSGLKPIAAEDGDLELALHGSFLPVPDLSVFGDTAAFQPGATACADGDIVLNAGRELVEVSVTNTGDRPIQVGSHYHFLETNAALVFDRGLAYGRRLNVPSGSSVRFDLERSVPLEPGGGAWAKVHEALRSRSSSACELRITVSAERLVTGAASMLVLGSERRHVLGTARVRTTSTAAWP